MLTFEEFSTKMKALLVEISALGDRSKQLLSRATRFEARVDADTKLEELRAKIEKTDKA